MLNILSFCCIIDSRIPWPGCAHVHTSLGLWWSEIWQFNNYKYNWGLIILIVSFVWCTYLACYWSFYFRRATLPGRADGRLALVFVLFVRFSWARAGLHWCADWSWSSMVGNSISKSNSFNHMWDVDNTGCCVCLLHWFCYYSLLELLGPWPSCANL